jgi:hypothetical protein
VSRPIEIDLKRPLQKSYPHINGLYLLLRATGLGIIEGTGRKKHIVPDEAVLESWHGLNQTEKYFTLFEVWILWGNPRIIGERGSPLNIPLMGLSNFFQRIPEKGLRIAGNRDVEQVIPYTPGLLTLALSELFGLISVQHAKPEPGKGWRIAQVHRTPYGDAILQLMLEYFRTARDVIRSEDEMDRTFGELQPVIQVLFPEWRTNLVIPKPEFQEGIFIFKVSMGGIWRRIALSGQWTFEDLSDTILEAFDFDHDHLYCFIYTNRFGDKAHINHPYMDEPPFTDEVLIGDLFFKAGISMIYWYDFGDDWKFNVELERIDPIDEEMNEPLILEIHGESPDQYPMWDDEDWDWEE